ncbi:hypothetical protein CYFUS_009755 [Cystobacter fuscus]|uniref:RING-type E3 ubiquitin transferase n=1 Tax=Cystobacter fuscus TaxID=43 RepID=A0A250JKW4_9BACT|nr:hypothetical protein [Cystobacter fuscus]ATB44268.1 hypothetical protein CYFUS_009755 [Cystobacter fuscus]
MQDAMTVVLLLGLGVSLAGIALLVVGRTLRARLRRMPRTLVREARAGAFVKMVGQVVAREPVHAPLADVDCAYFQMTVQEVQEEMKKLVETVYSEKEYATGCGLDDESGRIELEPEGAVFHYLRAREFAPGLAAWVPEIRQDLLARYISAREGRTDLRTRLREERLELGTTVVALGWVREGPRGLVLTGGSELEVFGETEKQLSSLKGSDVLGGVLLAVGLLLCAAGVSALG